MGLTDNIDLALRSAPQEVQQDPSIAAAAGTSPGDPQQNAEVTAHLMNTQAQQQAVDTVAQHHGGHGLLGATLSWLGQGVSSAEHLVGTALEKVGQIASMPLQDIQHQYRYLRDVESNHGFAAMLLQALPMTVGATIGGVVGGGEGAVLGAEGAGSLFDRFMGYDDSWKRTNSATYVDPHGGQQVSPGRDVARLLGSLTKHVGVHIEQHKGFDLFDVVSGMGDGIFDLTTDPLAEAAGIRHAALSEEGAGGLLRARWGGIAASGGDVVRAAEQYPSVARGFEHIASMDSAADIAHQYPKFTFLAPQLAEAKTARAVGQVFTDAATSAEMEGRLLPRRAIGNVLFNPVKGALAEKASQLMLTPAEEDAGRVGRIIQTAKQDVGQFYSRVTTMLPTSVDPLTGEQSRKFLFFNDPNSANTVYDWARWGHTDGVARQLATDWAQGDITAKQLIYRNLKVDNFANRMEAVQKGWSETPDGIEILRRLGDEADQHFGGIDGGRTTPYAFDQDGRVISKFVTRDGKTVSVPVLEHDMVKAPIDNYLDFDRALKALGNGSKMYGKVDDFLFDHFTQSVFKRWALASLGFATRVASGELLPYVYRDGAEVLRSRIATSLADRGWSMTPGETDGIMAGVGRFLAKGAGVTDEDIGKLADNMKLFDGAKINPAVSTGHDAGQEIIGTREYTSDTLRSLVKDVNKGVRVTDDRYAWGPEHDDHYLFWQKQAEDLSKSPAMRAQAAAYRDALNEGVDHEAIAHEAATKAADDAAEAAVRRAALAKPRAAAPAAEGEAAAQETEVERAARLAAQRSAKQATELEIAPPEGTAPARASAKAQEPLSPELRDVVDRVREQTYKDAYAAALKASRENATLNATKAAVEAGKDVLDSTPEEILNQHMRHFFSPSEEDSVRASAERGGEPQGEWKWVKNESVDGKPSTKSHWEYQPYKRNVDLASPIKIDTGHYEYQAPEGTYTIKRDGKNWTLSSPDKEDQQFKTWGDAVNVMSRNTARSPTFVEGSVEMPGGYSREFVPAEAPQVDPHREWAATQAEWLKATIYGQDGTLHDEILNAIADGRTPDTEFMSEIPMEQRPAKIMGAYEKPAAPDRLNDRIFKKLNAVINWMSREPIYNTEYLKQINGLQKFIDNGSLTYEEAQIMANRKAVEETLPHIHNINERSLMSEHARNFIPFYFAQQQSYARMFRLLAEDPAAFRRIQLTYTNLANFGGIYNDANGNTNFIMPGAGFLTGGSLTALSALGVPIANGVPSTMSGSLKSLASLSPFLEGSDVIRPGPLVALGLRAIQNLLPEAGGVKAGFTNLESGIVGSQTMAQQAWQVLVPNTAVRAAMQGFMPMDNRTEAKSVLDAIQSLEYQQNVAMDKWVKSGKSPDDPDAPHLVPTPTDTPMQRQQFIDRVKNTARVLSMTKAVVAAFSPTSPSVQIGDYKLKTELYNLMSSNDPATGKPYGISGAITQFLLNHPDATPYTVFETNSGTMSPIQSTHPAMQWVQNNMDTLKNSKYSSAASYFVPQTDDKFNQTIYNEQMAMGLRSHKAPDQMIQDINVAEGNRWYFDTYLPAKNAALSGVHSSHQKQVINDQFSKAGGKDLNGNPIISLAQMKLQNPIWYDNFSSGGRIVRRDVAIQQMQQGIKDGVFDSSPMMPLIKDLLNRYNEHAAALLPGRVDSFATAARNAEKVRWQNQLKAIADAHPELDTVINGIFRGV